MNIQAIRSHEDAVIIGGTTELDTYSLLSDSTVDYGRFPWALSGKIPWGYSWEHATAKYSATVDTGGVISMGSLPTNQGFVYLTIAHSTELFDNYEISTKPKSSKTIYGSIVEKTIGKFETD